LIVGARHEHGDFSRNGCPDYAGTGVRFPPESVSGFARITQTSYEHADNSPLESQSHCNRIWTVALQPPP